MGQRLQFFCDVHELQDEDAIADPELPILGFNGKFYKFFFCKPCFTDNAMSPAELMEMVTTHGLELKPEDLAKPRPTSGPAKNPGRFGSAGTRSDKCLWCVYTGSTGALNIHVKRHGFKGFKDAFGDMCPVCNGEFPALGNHGKGHEAYSTAHLFEMAEKLGDPHGIVAARRALKAA